MEPFTRLTAVAVPFDTPDIDTDMIIPQRFLRKPLTVGYRNFLFFNDRFDAAGKEKPDFILHREPYKKARIFVTGTNFGCGSTREGAVYAVTDFGVRAVIAPSFGAFYASNSYQNGLLPVVLPDADVRKLREQLHAKPGAVSTAMQARDVAVDEKVEDDEVKSVKSVGAVSLEAAVSIATAAGGRVEPDVVIDEADLVEYLVEEAG